MTTKAMLRKLNKKALQGLFQGKSCFEAFDIVIEELVKTFPDAECPDCEDIMSFVDKIYG